MPKPSSQKKPAAPLLVVEVDHSWRTLVRPVTHFEESVISIYGQQIRNNFVTELNRMMTDLGTAEPAHGIAAIQSAAAAAAYLAHTMRHGSLRRPPADPVARAASVIAAGFLSSPYNRGGREFIEPGPAPFGFGDEPLVFNRLIDEANRQCATEHFSISCILSGMLHSIGHFAAWASTCDCCVAKNPDLQGEMIRSIYKIMKIQYDECKNG